MKTKTVVANFFCNEEQKIWNDRKFQMPSLETWNAIVNYTPKSTLLTTYSLRQLVIFSLYRCRKVQKKKIGPKILIKMNFKIYNLPPVGAFCFSPRKHSRNKPLVLLKNNGLVLQSCLMDENSPWNKNKNNFKLKDIIYLILNIISVIDLT